MLLQKFIYLLGLYLRTKQRFWLDPVARSRNSNFFANLTHRVFYMNAYAKS